MRIAHSIKALVLAGGMALVGVGCAANNGPMVPSGAMQMASGDRNVAFTAPHDGTVYLRDDGDNKILYSGDVQKDQSIHYDPNAQQVVVDGRVVADKVPGGTRGHSLFFERADRPDRVAMQNNNGAQPETTTNGNGYPVIKVPVGVQVEVQPHPAETQPQQ